MLRLLARVQYVSELLHLLMSWQEFLCGKRGRKDVGEFSLNLMDNIMAIHQDLADKTYKHGGYQAFKINDPKPRDIHKASVRDRLVHHAIYRVLYPFFDGKFIHDSYSCRNDKGTHRAVQHFREFAGKVSENNTQTAWILQCDIRKFFANIDHTILKGILVRHINDDNILWLLGQIINSFNTKDKAGIGLPLGNFTSQLFINVYMNEFDQFMKRDLKAGYYIRYADDFVIMSEKKDSLERILPEIERFLYEKLKLSLNVSKTQIRTLSSGIDFLGYVILPHHIVLRTKTKKRMLKRVNEKNLPSYLGILKHCDGYKVEKRIKAVFE